MSVKSGAAIAIEQQPRGFVVFLGDDTGARVQLGFGYTRPVALDLAKKCLAGLVRLVEAMEYERPP